MFGKKQEESKPSTLEEVKKAYENLSDDDKKSFHNYQQSISDRVHESVAAQEREHGQENSQSAEMREHEALSEEHADGEGDVSELHEEDDAAEEKAEEETGKTEGEEVKEDNSQEEDNRNEIIKSLTDRISALEESFKEFGALKEKMDEYTRKQAESFGLPGKVIGGSDKNMLEMSASELKEAILSGQK